MHTCAHTQRDAHTEIQKNTHFRIFSDKAVETQAYHPYWPVTHDCHSLSCHPSCPSAHYSLSTGTPSHHPSVWTDWKPQCVQIQEKPRDRCA